MKNIIIVTLFALATTYLNTGCSLPHHSMLAPGKPLPPNKILVVTRAEFNPQIIQNFDYEKYCVGHGCAGQGEVEMFLYRDNDEKIDKGLDVPAPMKGATEMHVSFEDFSFILMPAGKWYIRHGIVTHTKNPIGEAVICGTSMPRYGYRKLLLYGDLEINIPRNTQAVYIGNLRYDHDGAKTQRVQVDDDYNQARQALEKMDFPNIKGSDMKKVLATVVNTY